jgi:antirestriction protein
MLKIYLTDLQAYNEGHLVGRWIELPLTPFKLQQALSEILTEGEHICKTNNHEEYFITDYEWDDVEVFEVGEYENLPKLNQRIEYLDELDETQMKAVAFLQNESLVKDLNEAIEKVDEVIIYENCTMVDIAEQYINEHCDLNGLSTLIVNNIDYQGIAKEFEMDGCYFEIGGDIYMYIG